MELADKLKVLADSAKYDVSCVSSGSSRKNTPGGVGNSHAAGICHTFTGDGRCVSLLKVLLSNQCIYDCAYCINRASNGAIRRTAFTPEEIASLTINFYRRNYIEGLFLSSAVVKSPDHTMELFIRTLRLLREECRFNGYIHVKAIPGADEALIEKAGAYADRISVNIELPTSGGLKLLAPQKKKDDILGPMGFISRRIRESAEDAMRFKSAPQFAPAGQSTQLIIGATPNHDIEILRLSEGLYRKFGLKRVFYSAYVPVSDHPALPKGIKPPLLREHRIYQADWLLRFYGFKADELLDECHRDFDILLDPKCDWALRNLHRFPVEVNKADYEELLRVPGIGVRSAQRIIKARKFGSLDFADIKKLGAVLKRARFFITCGGKYIDRLEASESFIRANLLASRERAGPQELDAGWTQLSFLPPSGFPSLPDFQPPAGILSQPAAQWDAPGMTAGRRSVPELSVMYRDVPAQAAKRNAAISGANTPLPPPSREDVIASITGEL